MCLYHHSHRREPWELLFVCVGVCVCVCVCVCVHMYTHCTCPCIHAPFVHQRLFSSLGHTYIHAYMNTYARMHMYMSACTCGCQKKLPWAFRQSEKGHCRPQQSLLRGAHSSNQRCQTAKASWCPAGFGVSSW
jgi:hypothetical protein